MTRRTVDLAATRRARTEADDTVEPPVVLLAGETFELPPRLPAAVIMGLARARRQEMEGFEDAIRSLFGERTSEILALGLELDDLDAIITGAYGDEEGETAPE